MQNNYMSNYKMPFSHLLNPGHTACAGCGMIIALRHAIDACGRDTIVCGATGCSEVTTTKYPTSAFKVPYIHSLFENPGSVASGVAAMLRRQGQDKKVNVLVHGGDGFFFDIGLALNSGVWARGENVLFICYDNEAYMNTGVQASSSTPHDSFTMTSPSGSVSTGNKYYKKDLPAIALAHGLPYVATATIGNLLDFDNKVKKALTFDGPKYIQVYSTCVPGWNVAEADSIKVARLAQQTGLYPVLEYEHGKLTNVVRVPKEPPRVEEFLKLQGRYRHLFGSDQGASEIAKLQALADENIAKYNLK
jgi:pyruvate ferredoxin oxidoreductase beta subunit